MEAMGDTDPPKDILVDETDVVMLPELPWIESTQLEEILTRMAEVEGIRCVS